MQGYPRVVANADSTSVPFLMGQAIAGSREQGPITLLLTFDDGRLHAQHLNRRLTKSDVAQLLRTTEEGVAFLVRKGCLKPLGRPEKTKQKLFAAKDVFSQAQDSKWLAKITDHLYHHAEEKNVKRNKRKRSGHSEGAEES